MACIRRTPFACKAEPLSEYASERKARRLPEPHVGHQLLPCAIGECNWVFAGEGVRETVAPRFSNCQIHPLILC